MLSLPVQTRCNAALLKNTGLKFIGTATIGYDHIDTAFCDTNGITWTNAPGCNSSSVGQYIAAAILRISGTFKYKLKNKTLGIVGVGNVGSKVEKLARTLEMNVLLNDPPRERAEGEGKFVVLNSTYGIYIVTVHVPLNLTGTDCT